MVQCVDVWLGLIARFAVAAQVLNTVLGTGRPATVEEIPGVATICKERYTSRAEP